MIDFNFNFNYLYNIISKYNFIFFTVWLTVVKKVELDPILNQTRFEIWKLEKFRNLEKPPSS